MARTIKAMRDKILAEMPEKIGTEKTTAGGIILTEKDGTEEAIKPRWFKVHSIGEGIDWITEGAYVLVAHGRWSLGMKIDEELTVHLLDNKDCLMVSDTDPTNDPNFRVHSKAIPKRPSNDMTRHTL
jgi:co-chaperonin GroES (HSP10)